jgi:hypothetical protein
LKNKLRLIFDGNEMRFFDEEENYDKKEVDDKTIEKINFD